MPFAAATTIFLLLLYNHETHSETSRITKIVVPAPPGDANDVQTRLLAAQISRTRGVTIVIENRPGANTMIGTEEVSRASPDGNTLLTNSPSAFTIVPHVRTLTFDPLTSFEPICSLMKFPTVIVVNDTSPFRTLADLLNAARAKPGQLTLASIGPASLVHVAFERLKRTANVDMTFVPFPGPGPAVNALLGGHVSAYFGNYSDAAANLSAGKLRALATASRSRIASLPDVPTIAESGYAGYELEGWFGLFAPAKTPKSVVVKLAEWFTTATQDAEVKTKLASLALYPAGVCGADFAAQIRQQYEEYGRIIREAGIRPN